MVLYTPCLCVLAGGWVRIDNSTTDAMAIGALLLCYWVVWMWHDGCWYTDCAAAYYFGGWVSDARRQQKRSTEINTRTRCVASSSVDTKPSSTANCHILNWIYIQSIQQHPNRTSTILSFISKNCFMYCARACEQKSNSSRVPHKRSAAMEHIGIYICIAIQQISEMQEHDICAADYVYMCLLILVKVVMYIIPTFTYIYTYLEFHI